MLSLAGENSLKFQFLFDLPLFLAEFYAIIFNFYCWFLFGNNFFNCYVLVYEFSSILVMDMFEFVFFCRIWLGGCVCVYGFRVN